MEQAPLEEETLARAALEATAITTIIPTEVNVNETMTGVTPTAMPTVPVPPQQEEQEEQGPEQTGLMEAMPVKIAQPRRAPVQMQAQALAQNGKQNHRPSR